jgi:uncharacterized protein YbjQ (UPF0145 family)
MKDLEDAARRLRSDAVVGIVMSSYSGGIASIQQAVGVHLLGTAVSLAKAQSPSVDTQD